MITTEPQVKEIGELIRVKILPFTEEEKNLFKDILEKTKQENWEEEDIVEDWYEKTNNILFNTSLFQSSFNTIPVYEESVIEGPEGQPFIQFKEKRVMTHEALKNCGLLSGEGKIITPFDLTFTNFKKTYSKDSSTTFFMLNNDEFIINNIRLVKEDSKPKLTGRAAEIARRKGLL